MTDRFVGIGGNDGNSGLTWALRKLTLNGVEDTPVVAGDTIYVGPGAYREQLTVDVSGSSGNPITYIGDVSGENTDEVGGIVRITASDDDQSGTRDYCVYASAKTYRTFRGFAFDMANISQVYFLGGCNGLIIEDCFFGTADDDADHGIKIVPVASDLFNIKRCLFMCPSRGIFVDAASDIAVNASSTVENSLFVGAATSISYGVTSIDTDNFTIKNCSFVGQYVAVRASSFATSQKIDVTNCIFERGSTVFWADVVGEIVEDYNSIPLSNTTPRANTNVGTNSNTYPALFEPPVLLDTFAQFPWKIGELSEWSELKRIAGSSESSNDLYGTDRPATSAKKSWGAIQYKPGEMETTTTYDSSAASIKLADAGRHQIFVPVTAVSTTISVRVYREANYAGTLPQMVIRQPEGHSWFTTDVGAVSTWNLLSILLTPYTGTDFVVVELVSNNTATSGSYAVFFDALSVS